MAWAVYHENYCGAPETHRSADEFASARELLEEARANGQEFTDAWDEVMGAVSHDVAVVLDATAGAWRASYYGEPVEPRAWAAHRLRDAAPA